ncbi:hypothetical protein N8I74_11000 [Chitiniphilus purpureus]|uniref:Phospholipase D-like domain-containing protein n=1 Tax=Chitiniphilus purpureus TaxID=2981137 RepID=A0ABY6DHM7_9NEIS|nr:hypothetical protein [Chitiniphilus sp. CD1]UXY13849.1 hypothetical protein N8I74_11000 [Chitiniphilus sp. CD1]
MIDIDLTVQPQLDLSGFESARKREKENKRKASAVKTKSRIEARFAKSEEVLSSILPSRIETGDSWHVLSSGDVDALSFLAHLLRETPMDYVAFSTWCMAAADVHRIAEWVDSGRIKHLDAYVGEIFPNQYADAHQLLCALVRRGPGRVVVFRNHSKLFLCRSLNRYWVVESSANINTNPRSENTVITASEALFEHHKQYLDRVRSFNRDFDDRGIV